MAKTTNPYWREESRIYHLELEIARTSNPQKKRELGYLLEKEKTALQQRKWRDREARNYQIKTIRKTRRRKIVYYTCCIAGIIIVSFFIISKFFYPNVEKLDLENHPATNFITQLTKSEVDSTNLTREQVEKWAYYHLKLEDPTIVSANHYWFDVRINQVREVEVDIFMEEVAVANYVVDANGHLYRMTASDKKMVANKWDVPENFEIENAND